jgi:hypothetical protein
MIKQRFGMQTLRNVALERSPVSQANVDHFVHRALAL